MQIVLAYLTLVIIWTTTPLAIQWSSIGTDYLFGLLSRMLIGVFICYLTLLIFKQKIAWNSQAFKAYLAASIGVFGTMFIVYWSSRYIPSGLIAVIFGLTPLFTSFFEYLILGMKNLTFYKTLGIAVGVIGLIIIFNSDFRDYQFAFKGIIGIFFATLMHSISSVLIKKYQRQEKAMTITTASLILSMPFFFLAWYLFGQSLPEQIPTKTGLSILYLGIIGTGIGFTLYYFALHKTNASSLALINFVTPVTGLLFGAMVNNEPLTLSVLYGTLLIVLGLLLNYESEKQLDKNANSIAGK